MAAASAVRHETPFFKVFAHRHAGMQTLHWIIRASNPADGFPPSEPVSAPAATVARELRVSRTHIRRMLGEAEREGFVIQGHEGQVLFTERLCSELRWILSSVMIGLLVCAAKTAREAIAPRIPLALSA